jgi:hypothetical protein
MLLDSAPPPVGGEAILGESKRVSRSYQLARWCDLTQMTYPSGRVVNFNYATGGGCCNSRLDSVADQTTSTPRRLCNPVHLEK